MTRAKTRWAALLVAAVLTVGACSGTAATPAPSAASAAPTAAPSAAQSALDRVKSKGLYVAFVGENPWAFLQPDGTWDGAEAEMVKYCAGKLGITEIFPVNVLFDGLLPGLDARRFDMIAAGMSIREARLQVAISSQLLYRYGTRIAFKEGDELVNSVKSWTDAGKTGLEVAMIRGSTEVTDTAQFGVKVKEYADIPTELNDLIAGRVRMVALNDNFLKPYLEENPDAPIVLAPEWDYQGVVSLPGHYFHKDDVVLRDAFNDCYSEMKTNGEMAKILEKWGFDPKTIPPPGPGFPPGAPS